MQDALHVVACCVMLRSGAFRPVPGSARVPAQHEPIVARCRRNRPAGPPAMYRWPSAADGERVDLGL